MAKECDANTGATKKATPLKLEFLDGDTLGFCDAETGICTVPNPAVKADRQLLQPKPASNPSARHRSQDDTGSTES